MKMHSSKEKFLFPVIAIGGALVLACAIVIVTFIAISPSKTKSTRGVERAAKSGEQQVPQPEFAPIPKKPNKPEVVRESDKREAGEPILKAQKIKVAAKSISEDEEGQKWSHKELIGYLKDKGLKFTSFSTSRGAAHGPAMYFTTGNLIGPGMDDVFDIHGGTKNTTKDGSWGLTVYVQKRVSLEEAKDRAGVLGSSGISWGRFIVAGDRELLQPIDDALHGKRIDPPPMVRQPLPPSNAFEDLLKAKSR
jgi:hypothetical protein